MPGKLMRYSGLITKARAMSSGLLNQKQFEQLTEIDTVNEAVQYLRETKGYHSIYREHDGIWHRGQAEAVIETTLYQDFEKLYRFSDSEQKEAFWYVFFRYEVDLLKYYVKQLFQTKHEEKYVDAFFHRHVCFSIEKLENATSIQELQQFLKGTIFEKVFAKIYNPELAGYMEYATQLDIFYYTTIYRSIKSRKKTEMQAVLLEIYGTQIDWLNIMWIYRIKRFYKQTPEEILYHIIPYNYRLKKEEIQKLTEVQTVTELNQILEQTAYFRGKDAFVRMEDEISYRQILNKVYQNVVRKYPVSMAPVLKYIYEKEQEIGRLTTIIEGIRYQVPAKDIKDIILITI